MKAREYFKKRYGHPHIEAVVEMKDWISLYELMDEYAEWKIKNCYIPNVVGQSEQLCFCGQKLEIKVGDNRAWRECSNGHEQ